MVLGVEILVTGCAGYIGSILTPMLLERGYRVRCVDRLLYGDRGIRDLLGDPRFQLLRKDTREATLEDFRGVDAVIDMAAIAQPDPKRLIPEEYYEEINYRAAVRTASLAKKAGARRLVFFSTCSVYGARDEPVDEGTPPNPLEAYARTKARAEREILGMADQGFAPVALRVATVYGYSPKMRFDLVVNAMTLSLWEKGVIYVGRPGTQVRPLVHVRDVARAAILALEADEERVKGEVFNVGSNEQNYRMLDLAHEIGRAIGKPYKVELVGEPDTRNYIVRFDKIRRVLGFQPRYTVSDGAREVYKALEEGLTRPTPETRVVEWIARLIREGRL